MQLPMVIQNAANAGEERAEFKSRNKIHSQRIIFAVGLFLSEDRKMASQSFFERATISNDTLNKALNTGVLAMPCTASFS